MESLPTLIGIDIGGTKILIVLSNRHGQIIEKFIFPSQHQDGYAVILHHIVLKINELIKRENTSPITIGVGCAGQIDPHSGSIIHSQNLNWRNVPLKQDLEQHLKIPVYITNDVRASTWAEWKIGAAKDCANFACMQIGTGLGGGIVLNNQLLEGNNNTAGEFGHITIDIHGRKCSCGNYGCLESICSGWAIAKHAQELIQGNVNAGKNILRIAGGNIHNVTAKHVIQAYREHDFLAKQIIAEAIEGLVAGASSIVNILNPERLIVSGGIVQGLPEIIDELTEKVPKHALAAACKDLRIERSTLGYEQGAIGAALYALNKHH